MKILSSLFGAGLAAHAGEFWDGNKECSEPAFSNMKFNPEVAPTNGLNVGSKVSIMCINGYQLNIPDKLKTAAECQCTSSGCHWKFAKGDVVCSKCTAPIMQGKGGKGVLGKTNWTKDSLGMMLRIKPYKKSTDGWHVALKFDKPIIGKETSDYDVKIGDKAWDWPFFHYNNDDEFVTSDTVDAGDECCDEFDVTFPNDPSLNGIYTKGSSFGKTAWNKDGDDKSEFKIMGAICNGKYYWSVYKVTYNGNSTSGRVHIRAWDFNYDEVCVDETSGWKYTASSERPDPIIKCVGDVTTTKPVTSSTSTPSTTTSVVTTEPPTKPPTQTGVQISAAGLRLTAVSKNNDMFTFTPNKNNQDFDISAFAGKKMPLMFNFENLTDEERKTVENPTILYYKVHDVSEDHSCYIDRFTDYPL